MNWVCEWARIQKMGIGVSCRQTDDCHQQCFDVTTYNCLTCGTQECGVAPLGPCVPSQGPRRGNKHTNDPSECHEPAAPSMVATAARAHIDTATAGHKKTRVATLAHHVETCQHLDHGSRSRPLLATHRSHSASMWKSADEAESHRCWRLSGCVCGVVCQFWFSLRRPGLRRLY